MKQATTVTPVREFFTGLEGALAEELANAPRVGDFSPAVQEVFRDVLAMQEKYARRTLRANRRDEKRRAGRAR